MKTAELNPNYVAGTYLVEIFPYDQETPAKIFFKSAADKEDYVDHEYKFCREEYATWQGENKPEQRTEKRTELMKKRVAFATHLGYSRSLKNRFVWDRKAYQKASA